MIRIRRANRDGQLIILKYTIHAGPGGAFLDWPFVALVHHLRLCKQLRLPRYCMQIQMDKFRNLRSHIMDIRVTLQLEIS